LSLKKNITEVCLFITIILNIFTIASCYRNVIGSDSSNESELLYNKAEKNLSEHRFNQALFEFSEILDKDADFHKKEDVLYKIAYINVIIGNYIEAMDYFDIIHSNYPDGKWSFSTKIWQQVLNNIVETPQKTGDEKNNRDKSYIDDRYDACHKENIELRKRIDKLEKIIEVK